MTISSVQPSSQLLLGEILKRASHKTPNQDAFVFEGERITYQKLSNRASHLAGWLRNQGIDRDDKVAFMLKNSLAFVDILFGVTLSGGVGVPINFRLAPNEVEYIIHNSDSKMLFIDQEYYEMIQSNKKLLEKIEKVIVVGSKETLNDFARFEDIYTEETDYRPNELLRDDDPALLVYTSGTTGRPKGAVLTHKNIYMNLMNLLFEGKGDLHQRYLITVPLFHIAGLSQIIMTGLFNGVSVIHPEFNPSKVLETIETERINTLFLVPSMWNFLFQVPNYEKYDVSSVTTCSTGAAISPLELKKRILNHFKSAELVDTFGQTETSSSTTYIRGEDTLRKTSSVGKAMINVDVRVVDEEMNDVAIGEIGEIVYRGPTVMKEYYKNMEATEEAFTDGWFRSGDLVLQDEEGFIYVVDRKKNMIISGGENIYPAEVEEVLYQIPEILECAVVGVPDKDWGESVKAFLVLKPGKRFSEEDVINYCKQNLASYKKPKIVEFMDELPRNASGKILKYVLQNKEQERMSKNK